ncbi:MAG: TatD family hydrolase [Verrucomicrobiia bacterium]
MLIDTHAHLCYPDFANDLPQIVERARAGGVERIVSIATDLDSAKQTLDIARRFDGVFAAVGLHPGEVPRVTLHDMKQLGALANESKVLAIGETGLDYYREAKNDAALRQQQKDLFWAHLELAKERRLAVVIHNRASEADILEILRTHAESLPKDWRPWGVMHCFGGDEKFALDCIEIGLLISYTGILTFKNAAPLREVAKNVSLDFVMLETDAPYLAPRPHRGKRNEPSYVSLIAETLAQVKGVSVEEVARATTENARRLFRFDEQLTR